MSSFTCCFHLSSTKNRVRSRKHNAHVCVCVHTYCTYIGQSEAELPDKNNDTSGRSRDGMLPPTIRGGCDTTDQLCFVMRETRNRNMSPRQTDGRRQTDRNRQTVQSVLTHPPASLTNSLCVNLRLCLFFLTVSQFSC